MVDDEDFERVNRYKWRFHREYAIKHFKLNKKDVGLFLHRFIMGLNYGDKKQIDHINHNGLDNRKCNLRLCTVIENRRNSSLRSDNTSGYKGVHWYKKTNKWQARIKLNKRISLGLFPTPIAAARAYNIAAKKYFGEFAYLNPIKDRDIKRID